MFRSEIIGISTAKIKSRSTVNWPNLMQDTREVEGGEGFSLEISVLMKMFVYLQILHWNLSEYSIVVMIFYCSHYQRQKKMIFYCSFAVVR